MKTSHLTHTGLAIGTALITGVLTGCSHHGNDSKSSSHEVPVIDVAQVEQRPVTLYHTYPGSLHATESVDLVARVNGYLTGQGYKNSDLVNAGQVLFTIEDAQYADAVRQAEASLQTAKAALDYNTSRYHAIMKAAEADAVSKMEMEEARSNMEQSRQQVNQAEASLKTARTNLGYCTVRAPFKGHVTASAMSVGNYLNGGAAPVKLATIYDDREVRADFFIDDAAYIAMLRDKDAQLLVDFDHMPVNFSEDLPHSYTARLIYMSPDVDLSTGTLELRAMIDNKYDELRDGMYVNVSLPYDTDSAAIVVKDAAISTDQLGKYLYTVNDSNKVVYTPIKVGDVVDDTLRVVTSGVKPGMRYVTKALLKVRPEMTVKPRLEQPLAKGVSKGVVKSASDSTYRPLDKHEPKPADKDVASKTSGK